MKGSYRGEKSKLLSVTCPFIAFQKLVSMWISVLLKEAVVSNVTMTCEL